MALAVPLLNLPVLLGALALDAVMGDRATFGRHIRHPVVLMGNNVAWLERHLNRPKLPAARRRLLGILAILLLVAIYGGLGLVIQSITGWFAYGWVLCLLLAAILIAQRSLYDHVANVFHACSHDDPNKARKAVGQIVGRDTTNLTRDGVVRAAIESLAENFADGVVAPAFWFALAGLPGILAYKAINTADSMIGHRTEDLRDFGWAAARLDDVVNLVPARLAGLLMALAAPIAGGSVRRALTVMWTDASHHHSPNAGWPEAAAGGALGLALGGPRDYHEGRIEEAFLNPSGRKEALPRDIQRALHLLVAACALHGVLYGSLVLGSYLA